MTRNRRLERALLRSYDEAACPSTDALAAYALGALAGADRARVASHVASCPICQELVALCAPPAPRPALGERVRIFVAQLAPQPLALGLRGDGEQGRLRTYIASDLQIELTIPPPAGEAWEVVGQVLRGGEGLPGAAVTLRSGRRRARTGASDAQGFFAFQDLPPGLYLLAVAHADVRVEIRDLLLDDDA